VKLQTWIQVFRSFTCDFNSGVGQVGRVTTPQKRRCYHSRGEASLSVWMEARYGWLGVYSPGERLSISNLSLLFLNRASSASLTSLCSPHPRARDQKSEAYRNGNKRSSLPRSLIICMRLSSDRPSPSFALTRDPESQHTTKPALSIVSAGISTDTADYSARTHRYTNSKVS
jgi:hypothetical protein